MKNFLQHYWLAFLITFLIWAGLGWQLGVSALILGIILTLLEITFSFDNAVINSRVLVSLSSLWQQIFMTVGIIIAVFIVRFLLPIIIVMIGSHLGFSQAINLALHNPEIYSQHVEAAAPLINAFGATFLLMVALYFFIDKNKKIHWLKSVEVNLFKLSKIPHAPLALTLLVATFITVFTSPENQLTVGLSASVAILIYLTLHIVRHAISRKQNKNGKASYISHGWAAFLAFLYLEVLDASFSLDGVVGAFALTSNIVIIMAGLGAGAVWVRSMTLHLVRTKTLSKYIFLESGAHWAILALSVVMFLKLFGIELSEWFIGSIGLVLIGLSIYSSRRKKIS